MQPDKTGAIELPTAKVYNVKMLNEHVDRTTKVGLFAMSSVISWF